MTLWVRIVLWVVLIAAVIGGGWKVHDTIWQAGYRAKTAEVEAAQAKANAEAQADTIADLDVSQTIATSTRDELAADLASIEIKNEWVMEQIRVRHEIAAPPRACVPDPVVVRELEAARARAAAAADRLRRKAPG